MNLLVIVAGEIYLLQNLTADKFKYYLTANKKCFNFQEDKVLEDLQNNLSNATQITDPCDIKIKVADGIITLNIAD
jgi:hypothetical protein